MEIKAISRTVLAIIVVVVIIIAGVAAYILTQTGQKPVAGTIDVYVGCANTDKNQCNSLDTAELYWIVDTHGKTFKVGDVVNIVFHANSTIPNPHGFVVEDPDHKEITSFAVPPNSSATKQITLSVAGTYTIDCLYFCGPWHTQIGKMQEVTLVTVS